MLSLPEDWDYTTKGLAHICKDGVDSITTALKELERHGYLTRQRLRYDNGQLGDIEYTIHEQPVSTENTGLSPKRENPRQVKPEQAKPKPAEPEQENEPYALMVQPDDILISPREVDEHFGTMVCFHPRYALGDHHNHMDKDDFLREMYLDTVGHDEAGMKRYERMVNIVSSRFRHGPKTEERAIDEAMQKVISEKYLMLPLYLYDHSGLAMSTESFSGRAPHAEWDSGQVGWIYVSKEDALKEFDADKMTGAIRQKADALMRSEVAAYDSYLRGECYGFELYKNGELSDSCWGFMGNFSDVLKDMAEYLPDECKGMVDHLEEQERPATIIKTLLKHAKIQVDQAAKAFEHASRQQVLGESR